MTDLQETDDLGAHFGGRRRYSRREMLRFGVTGAGIIGVSPLLAACASSASTACDDDHRHRAQARGHLELRAPDRADPARPSEFDR